MSDIWIARGKFWRRVGGIVRQVTLADLGRSAESPFGRVERFNPKQSAEDKE